MIHGVIVSCLLLGLSGFGPPPLALKTKQELQKRGMAESFENVCLLADEAFVNEDEVLFDALFANWPDCWERNRLVDKILALYKEHANTAFKKKISVLVACWLTTVDRICQSRHGCEFYSLAVKIMFERGSEDNRMYALICIENISQFAGLLATPHFIKMLMVIPNSDLIVFPGALESIEGQFPSVTPEMAYHIYRRYKDDPCFEDYKRTYEERAKSLLDAPTLPESASRTNVLKVLDKMIDEEGHKYLEKYKDVELKPYVPPPPDPNSGPNL